VRETEEERTARRNALAALHGIPEVIDPTDALELAGITVVTADEVYASVYRDAAAADAWMGANLTQYGHPALARVPLADGRVIGILDLRPALRKLEGRHSPGVYYHPDGTGYVPGGDHE